MSAPFQPGDVVVCVDASTIWCETYVHFGTRTPVGAVLRVTAVAPLKQLGRGKCQCLGITSGERGGLACRFRKIDDEVTDEFREQLRKLPVKDREHTPC